MMRQLLKFPNFHFSQRLQFQPVRTSYRKLAESLSGIIKIITLHPGLAEVTRSLKMSSAEKSQSRRMIINRPTRCCRRQHRPHYHCPHLEPGYCVWR